MAIIYSNGNFHVEAVIVSGCAVFRVCEYQGTKSTVLNTFESLDIHHRMMAAINQCEKRAEIGAEQ